MTAAARHLRPCPHVPRGLVARHECGICTAIDWKAGAASRRAVLAGAAGASVVAFTPRRGVAAACPSKVTVSHRTYDGIPGLENTIEGARRSLAAGVTAVEVDVLWSAPEPSPVVVRGRRYDRGERELVLLHDNGYGRTHGVRRQAEDVPWSVAARWPTLEGQPTATLREMVEYVGASWPGRGIMLQLKGTRGFDARAIARLFDSNGIDHRKVVVYKSDYRELDRDLLDPFVEAGFVAGLKLHGERVPPVSVSLDRGYRFAAANSALLTAPAGSEATRRLDEYAAAGITLSNAAAVGTRIIHDPRVRVLILHTEDVLGQAWREKC